MRWALRLAPLLGAFWLVLSGHFTPLLLGLGAGSVGLVVWTVHRMDVVDHESLPVHLSIVRTPRYCLWLAGKIVSSAMTVTRQVWAPRPRLSPAVGVTPTDDLPELSQVIYANSITLTPGTLSLAVNDEGIEVHGLQESGVEELQAGMMLRKLRHLETR